MAEAQADRAREAQELEEFRQMEDLAQRLGLPLPPNTDDVEVLRDYPRALLPERFAEVEAEAALRGITPEEVMEEEIALHPLGWMFPAITAGICRDVLKRDD